MTTAKGKASEELSRLEQTIAQDPASPEFHRLADAYTRAGRFLDAIRVAREGLKHHPGHAEGHVSLGRAFFGSGNLARAVKILRRVLALEEVGPEPYRLLGEILLWQSATTDALQLLEEAVEKGFSQPSLIGLRDRARAILDSEKTGVMLSHPAYQQGMGNFAVAGTIGTDHGRGNKPDEVTQRIAFSFESPQLPLPSDKAAAPPAGQVRSPSASKGAAGRAVPPPAEKKKSWESLEQQWEQRLAAQPRDGFDPDLSTPSGIQVALDLPLDPLPDPLSEELPPLPPDAEESGELASVQPVAPWRAAAAGEAPEPARAAPESLQGEALPSAESVAVGHDDGLTRRIVKESHRRSVSLDVPLSPEPEIDEASLDESSLDDLSEEDILFEPPRDELYLSLEPSSQGQGAEPRSDLATSIDQQQIDPLLSAISTAETSGSAEEVSALNPLHLQQAQTVVDPAAAARRTVRARRGAGWRWGLFICSLLILVGAGGYFGYRHHTLKRAGDQALRQAEDALLEGSYDALQSASIVLAKARAAGVHSPAVANSAGLLGATLELLHGVPADKQGLTAFPDDGQRSLGALLTAAGELLAGQPQAALDALTQEPQLPLDRALYEYLRGRSHWLTGEAEASAADLHQALIASPKLVPAFLLRGQLAREGGKWSSAEQALRQGLALAQDHAVIAFTLAAVLLASSTASPEIDALLGLPAASPVAKAWRSLVHYQRRLQSGVEVLGAQELIQLIASAPDDPALLFYASEVLSQLGQVDAAQEALARLQRQRLAGSTLRALEAELALAQGLESKALELLGDEQQLPRGTCTRGLAQLGLGRLAEAKATLGQVDCQAGGSALLLIEALQDPSTSLERLQTLATRSPQSKLVLAQALLGRQKQEAAAPLLDELAKHPAFQHRALTLRAATELAATQVAAALTSLNQAVRACPRYMPAQELLGRAYLSVGRFGEAAQVLSAAYRAGRRTSDLLAALARAQGQLGKLEEAAALLGEAQALAPQAPAVALAQLSLQIATGKLTAQKAPPVADDDAILLTALAKHLAAQGKMKEAERALERATSAAPASPLPVLARGELLAARGDRQALPLFTRAIELAEKGSHYPRSALLQAHLGIARLLGGKAKPPAEALQHVQQAIKTDPSAPEAYLLAGVLHLRHNRWHQAREALQRCLTLDPQNREALFALGVEAKSPRAVALQALEQFLTVEPQGPRAERARRALKRLR